MSNETRRRNACSGSYGFNKRSWLTGEYATREQRLVEDNLTVKTNAGYACFAQKSIDFSPFFVLRLPYSTNSGQRFCKPDLPGLPGRIYLDKQCSEIVFSQAFIKREKTQLKLVLSNAVKLRHHLFSRRNLARRFGIR